MDGRRVALVGHPSYYFYGYGSARTNSDSGGQSNESFESHRVKDTQENITRTT